MRTQIQLHKEWNKDIDLAMEVLQSLITKLDRIKNQAACRGLHDLDLPYTLDYFARYDLEELHDALEPVFMNVGTSYERGE